MAKRPGNESNLCASKKKRADDGVSMMSDASTVIDNTVPVCVSKNYDPNFCFKIIRHQEHFLNNNLSSDNAIVLNCITGKINNVDSSKLTWNHLKSTFQDFGHSLSMSFNHYYSLKLCLDFDYVGNQNDTVGSSEMIVFCKKLCSHLQKTFPQIEEFKDLKNVRLMRRNNNMHIYFNIDVSVCLYNVIVNHVIELHSEITNYKIDRLLNVPLPYSAKYDDSIYQIVSFINVDEEGADWEFGAKCSFYDFDAYTQTRTFCMDKILIMEFSIKPIKREIKSESGQLNLIKVYIDKKYQIIKTASRPSFLDNLATFKLNKINGTANFYQIIEYVKNVRKINKLKLDSFNDAVIDVEGDKDIKDILEMLEDFIKPIDDHVYFSGTPNIKVLLTFIKEYEDFSLYLIMLALVHLSKKCKFLNHEDLKCKFLKYLKFNLDNEELEYCLDQMIKQNIMQALIQSFDEYHNFLHYIILEYTISRMEKDDPNSNGDADRKNHETMSVSVYLDKLKSYLESINGEQNTMLTAQQIIKMWCNPIKYDVEQSYVYSRIDHIYELVKLPISNQFKLILSKFKNDKAKSIKDACTGLLLDLKSKHVRFNEYEHFINTEIGVFYTVTGTYLKKHPYFYFNSEKKYCTIFDSECSNLQTIRMYDKLDDVLERYLNCQNNLFYLTLMVPGLLKLEWLSYDVTETNQMWMCCVRKITNDVKLIDKFHYFIPLFQKLKNYTYALNLMCKCIEECESLAYRKLIDQFKIEHDSQSQEPTADIHVNTFVIAVVTLLLYMSSDEYEDNGDDSDDDDDDDKEDSCKTRKKIKIKTDQEHSKCACSEIEKLLNLANVKKYENGNLDLRELYERDESVYNGRNQLKLWQCVWSVVFPEDSMNMCIDLFRFLSTVFKYDENTIRDYFMYTCELYQHVGSQNHMSIYYGTRRSGKTTLLNMISEMVTDSGLFRTTKDYVFLKSSNGPSPNAIHMKTKYVTIINEIETISHSLLKTVTGNMYSHKFPMIRNTTILFAACNHIPRLEMPDEAIRDRVVFFQFTVLSCTVCDPTEPNCLLLAAKNTTFRYKVDESALAKVLSNFLYVYHKKHKNKNNFVVPRITNSNSYNVLNRFMIKNNYVYYLLHLSGIRMNPMYKISKKDVLSLVEPNLIHFNSSNNKKQISKLQFKEKFEECMNDFYSETIKMYIGFGISANGGTSAAGGSTTDLKDSFTMTSTELGKHLKIKKVENASTSVKKLKTKLKCIHHNIDVVNETIERLKTDYEYSAVDNTLVGVVISVTR